MTHKVRRLPLIASVVALATLAAACGGSSEANPAATSGGTVTSMGARTVDVVMEDIKFDPTTLTVQTGETIDFRFTNDGQVPHDAFIGDAEAQMDHDAEMAAMGDAAGGHTDETAIVVQPGEVGQLSYTFTKPGIYEVGCHQPGHYAAGMKIDITVE